jgi:DNA modification methylase
LHIARDRNWLKKQTAKLINKSETLVSEYLGIDELHRKGHTELKEVDDFGTARTKMRKINDRAEDADDEEMDELCSEITSGYKITEKSEIPIIHGNFLEWAPAYRGPKFNFLHCDFPYGIDTDKRNMGNAIDVHGGCDDSFDNYRRLLETLCTNLDRICFDSAQIMFWFSMHHYAYTLKFFEDHSNFIIEPHPLIWVKSDGKGMLPDRMHGPRRIYETCLFGRRGDRVTAASVANAYVGPTDRSADHPSAKPEAMLREFFEMFVDEKSKVLDPTCGSGSALRAAKSLGAAYVLGIEKDKNFAERATRSFQEWVAANRNGASAQDSTTTRL